jgi:PAS domain S-box-containing protein
MSDPQLDALLDATVDDRLLVSAVADYAIYLLDHDGRVSSWNLGAERLKGYSADEIVGRHFSAFYTDEDRADGLPGRALAAARAQGRWHHEGWRIRKDGSRFWAEVVITAIVGPDGALRGFTKVTRDLTDRKRHEDALRDAVARERDAAARLRELDRMRGDLVAIVTHDLRGPVGVLRNLVDLARRDGLTEDESSRLVDRMAGKVETLASLIDDVFEMTLLESDRLRVEVVPVRLDALLEQLAQDVSTGVGRSVQVRAHGPTRVLADPRRLVQVLDNLVSNAVEFSPPDTAIVITTSGIGRWARISVSDRGPGVPAEDRERVFEPFRRLGCTDGTPGTGLGLHIARLLVEGQGGRIWAEDGPEGGATFVVELPFAEPAPA